MAGTNESGGHGDPQLDLFLVESDGTAPMATHVAINSGNWFDPDTWADGEVPDEGALVHIPADVTVGYDGASDAALFMVRVDGTLTFTAEQNPATKMVVDTIVTSPDSTFNVLAGRFDDGTVDIVFAEGAPAVHSDFYSDHADGNGVVGRYDWDPSQLSLGLVASGEVIVRGQETAAHLKLQSGPEAGDTTLEFNAWDEGATSWKPGQQIVVGATSWLGRDDAGDFQSEDEVRTITAVEVNGDTMIVHLDEPLHYDHVGRTDPNTGQELTTSVGNLSRNVTFSSEVADKDGDGMADRAVSLGEDAGPMDHYVTERGHIMFMHNDDVRVENSSFFGLGRTDKSKELDDFVTVEDTGSIEYNHRVYEDAGEIGVFEAGVDTAIMTAAEEIQNMRGRYALHIHMAGVGHDGHNHMDDEGGVIGPCARSGDPICHCTARDEDGDGVVDYYLHKIGEDHEMLGDLGERVDTDGDGVVDSIRHDAATHQAFMAAQDSAQDDGALLRGNVVWGSPGWGIVQHDSKADLIGNVTFDVDGTGIVSESGNETGLWQGNATFGTYGTRAHVGNDDSDDFNDNFGHEGVGFWLHSRAIDVVDNVAISSARAGFMYRNNGVDLKDVDTSELGALTDIAHGADSVSAEDVPIARFHGNEVIGALEGIRIITDPLDSVRKYNDAWSHLTEFTGWEIAEAGVKLTYSSKYIFEDFLLLGTEEDHYEGTNAGFFFKVSVADITVVDSHVETFDKAILSWPKMGNRQEYRRGYWDPLSPWSGDVVDLHEGLGTSFGIDNPAYNLWNHNIVNVTADNMNTRSWFAQRKIVIEDEDGTPVPYEARQIWDAVDKPKAKSSVDIQLLDDSAKGGLVALWREDLANASDYAQVLRDHIPLAYHDSIYLSQVHFSNGTKLKRSHREDDGDGIAADIWSGTALEFAKHDSLGRHVFVYEDFSPLVPEETRLAVSTNEKIIFSREMIDGVLASEGYYSTPGSDVKFVAMRMIFTDRLTGDYTTKEFLVALDLAWEVPGGAVDNGLYQPHAHSVIAPTYAVFENGVVREDRAYVVPELDTRETAAVDPLDLEDGLALLRDAALDTGEHAAADQEGAISGTDPDARALGAAGGDTLETESGLLGGGGGVLWGRRVTDGDQGDNHIAGTARDEVFKGKGGDDLLQGRHGDDRLYGGHGEDILHGGHGRDLLHGGAGADRFRFDLASQDDVITDFEAELDRIEIQHTGLSRADLTIRQDGEDVLIEYAGNTIRVAGTDIGDIDESTLLVA
ncbi:MAG: hypothetical protein AAF415_02875 [Pseudomonadota bacterium]